jgi:MFS transporter, putative metabolite:H+ symporter
VSVTDRSTASQQLTADQILARIERLPISWWHVKTRIVVGIATFFDAFDALSIASVLPALVPLWKLNAPQIGFMISAGFVGQLLGALFFGWIAERYGRVTGMIWSIGLFAVMSCACAFAWDYESLLAFRIIQGFGLGGEVPIAAVYISELARTNIRGRFVMLYELIFPVGIVAASLLGLWIVPAFGWQYMFLVGAAPAILVLFLRTVLPESPRWLASVGRLTEADAAVSLIEQETEKTIGQPLPTPQPVVQIVEKQASISDLFGKLYLRRTLVVWLIWFTAYLVNYGLSIWMPTVYRTIFKLPIDVALRYGLITTALGLVGAAIAAFIVDQVGRRALFTICFLGGAVALITLAMISDPTAGQVLTYISISNFFLSAINLGVYLYTPELYPTRMRAIGVGVATAWLRLASIIGPAAIGFIVMSGLQSIFLICGALAAVTAAITAVFAVETRRRILEEVSP